MNNRNPNKENTYSNLAAWCEKYHKDSGIKIHPSSVPYDLVLEDVLDYIAILVSHDKSMTMAFDAINRRVMELEKNLLDCNAKLLELQNPIEENKQETKKGKK